ncbi:sensor histidine kinase [Geodermatophilus sp. URMC 62]|uniref:sensor histidine kinase n=1 Tax=Geodermatophilus sp. URMC 62 TaxID=3423414 RepID=UPI00406D1014
MAHSPAPARRIPPWLADVALTGAVTVVTAAQLLAAPAAVAGQRPVDAVAWALAALAALPVLLLRRRPWTAMALTSAGVVGYSLLGHPESISGYGVLVALYGVAARYPRRISLGAVPLVLAGMVVFSLSWPQGYTLNDVLADLLVTGAMWALGDAARTQRRQARALAERAREAEASREAHSREAVVHERLRIARELHDVMAHSMSVIAVQAGVGRHVMDRDPGTARRALAVVEDTSRRTLAEMRQLLGVLRVDDEVTDDVATATDGTATDGRATDGRATDGRAAGDGAAPAGAAAGAATRAPQPGLDRLGELLATARAAGSAVTLSTSGTPRPLTAQLDLAAYRILQEALTNAAKHAGPATVEVALTWRDDGLLIEVDDDGPGPASGRPGGGYGLVGLRERAASVGGDLETGPGPRGGFLLRARLPLPVRPAPAPQGLA